MTNIASLIPFQKGDDPRRNVTGQNKGCEHSKTRLKRLLFTLKTEIGLEGTEEQFTILELMDAAIIKRACSGDVKAYKEILDRFEDRTIQQIRTEGTVEVTNSLDLTNLSQEELEQYHALAKKCAKSD